MIKIQIYAYTFNSWRKLEKRFSQLVYYEGKQDTADNIIRTI
jgi:hypothetical protein